MQAGLIASVASLSCGLTGLLRAGSAAQSREQRSESYEYSSSSASQRARLSEAVDTAILKVSILDAPQQVAWVSQGLSYLLLMLLARVCSVSNNGGGLCLQAMLAMEDTGALLRFVQRPNRVALSEGEAALRAAGRYSELVALYQERSQFEAALDLLRTLSLVRACPPQARSPCLAFLVA